MSGNNRPSEHEEALREEALRKFREIEKGIGIMRRKPGVVYQVIAWTLIAMVLGGIVALNIALWRWALS